MNNTVRVVRKNEARIFMEGDEQCREYIKTEKILFGTSTLFPGQKGAVDHGHPNSHEVFYVVSGCVACHIPDKNIYVELGEGDIVLIEEGVPHVLINVGDGKAVVSWSCAPTP
ncbi:MAG: cupin domain-containing protein [Firmicutes bacterium]|nr:cupin domain-containing protein [Bacillota bacterium]